MCSLTIFNFCKNCHIKFNVLSGIFIVYLFISFTGKADNRLNTILSRSQREVQTLNAGSYYVQYKFRRIFGNGDTTTENAIESFKKKSNDSLNLIFNIHLLTYHVDDIYSGQEYVAISHNDKEIGIYDAAPVTRNKYDGFTWSPLLYKTILSTKKIMDLLNNSTKDSINLLDTSIMIGNILCYKICFHIADTLEAKNVYVYYYFRKSDFLPVKEVLSLDFQDQIQYPEYNITDIIKNKVDTNEFKVDYDKYKDYKILDNKNVLKNSATKLLYIDSAAPYWKLPALSADSLDLNKFIGKIVIIDFWYMSCYPCLKTLPVLQKLQDKYKSHLIVIGLNSYDKDTVKLKHFLAYRSITYKQTYNAQNTALKYGVTGYPTLFIIDKKGIIRKINIGYYDNLEAELDNQIKILE